MKPDPRPLLTPEACQALALSERLHAAMTDLPADPLEARREAYRRERRYWNEVPVELAAVEELTLTLAGIPAGLRLYRPSLAAPLPALIYLHGGGFVMGSLDTHDRIMRLLAQLSGCAVLGLDYALAPEHKAPLQVEQTVALVRRLGEVAGVEAARFALGGDSAGAHLALAAALALKDGGGPQPHCLLLYYGLFGLADSASRRLWGGPADGLSEAQLAYCRDAYLPAAIPPSDPRYDLLRRNLAGLPPALIAASALDPLLDDSRTLAALLEAAGSLPEVTVYDGVLHGFLHLSRLVPTAVTALEQGGRFVRRHLR